MDGVTCDAGDVAAGADGAVHFGLEHFGKADLGDVRRTRRLVHSANAIMTRPGGSLPQKLRDWSELHGLYRLLRRPEVTHQRVLEPHRQRTLELMRQTPLVLLLHDTTELDYSSHLALEDLGPVGNGRRDGHDSNGLLCHNTLAITPDRRVLGLPSQVLHRRRVVPKGETLKDKREHPGRESLLWLKGCSAIGPAPADCRWVDVADRGADTFEFLDFAHRQQRHYVIRSAKDRKLAGADHVGSDRIHQYLHGYGRDLPVLGTRPVQVHANRGRTKRAARQVTVSVSAGPARVAVPAFARGQCQSPVLDLWIIVVREIDPPPAGVEPLEWLLLTNVPTETLAQASQRLDWYECRPVVEELHTGFKSGIGIEELRFELADRLEPAIALLSVVAAMLLDLRQAAREPQAQQTLAKEHVPLLWVQVLSGWRYKRVREDLSLREFYMALGGLGGHLGRKGDGWPGWKKLWLGWTRLQAMIEGALAIQRKSSV
jgi:hypothetical protein